jgi:hypothetical protein
VPFRVKQYNATITLIVGAISMGAGIILNVMGVFAGLAGAGR